jgi:hypothetical protein
VAGGVAFQIPDSGERFHPLFNEDKAAIAIVDRSAIAPPMGFSLDPRVEFWSSSTRDGGISGAQLVASPLAKE